MVPRDAVLEAELAGGIVLLDVSHLLPVAHGKRYASRPMSGIVRQYHHHSGAMGRPGFAGALGTARYVVAEHGWAGAAYHYFLSHVADRDYSDRIVVYRLQQDIVRSYHTGGDANTHGIGVCWQGNLTAVEPSSDQIEAAEALIPWLLGRHAGMQMDPCPISWHSESARWGGSGKPTCPGPHVEAWLAAYREAT